MVKRKNRYLRADGYVWIYRKGKRVLEHRAVMEGLIGRTLARKEIVHHKNGKRTDNHPENLELMSLKQHAKLHGSERVCAMTIFICEYCHKEFHRRTSLVKSKIKHGENIRFCSYKCSGKGTARHIVAIDKDKYGEWTILQHDNMEKGLSYRFCKCSCGKKKYVYIYDLISGKSTKCMQCSYLIRKNNKG